MRQCGQCGADISHRAPQAKFCEDPECHRQRMLVHGRASYDRNRVDVRQRQNAAYRARAAAKPKPIRLCAHCKKDISDRGGRARWCNMKCREHSRYGDRQVHRWNVYAARVQRDAGFVVDPPLTALGFDHVIHAAKCSYCPAVGTMEPDHVVPLSRGGRHDPANIVPCCMSCNRSKRDATPAEWQARLVRLGQEYPQFVSSENLVMTMFDESG